MIPSSPTEHWAIKLPSRISVETYWDYANPLDEPLFKLSFSAPDGSCLSVFLSREQGLALTRLGPTDPDRMARDLYVAGHIEVDELEARLSGV